MNWFVNLISSRKSTVGARQITRWKILAMWREALLPVVVALMTVVVVVVVVVVALAVATADGARGEIYRRASKIGRIMFESGYEYSTAVLVFT